eukprot:283054_1
MSRMMYILFVLIAIAVATLWMSCPDITFQEVVESLSQYESYDIINGYLNAEEIYDAQIYQESFQANVTLESYLFMLRQMSPARYQSKENMIFEDPQRYSTIKKAESFTLKHCKIPTFQVDMRIEMSEATRTPYNVIGKKCLLVEKNSTGHYDYSAGTITDYDEYGNEHEIVLENGKRNWFVINRLKSDKKIKIIERTDSVTVIHPKACAYVLLLVDQLHGDFGEESGPHWSQFSGTPYGKRPDMWQGLKWNMTYIQKGDTIQ